jgi:AraC family transcriptional regulator
VQRRQCQHTLALPGGAGLLERSPEFVQLFRLQRQLIRLMQLLFGGADSKQAAAALAVPAHGIRQLTHAVLCSKCIPANVSSQGGTLVRGGRIALAVDSRHRPIAFTTPRWSSTETAWGGFPVEFHELGPRGRLDEFGIDHSALLVLCLAGSAQLRIGNGSAARCVTSSPGRFSLLHQGFEQDALFWEGTRQLLYVAIRDEQLTELMSQRPDLAAVAIEPQYAITDPHVVALVLAMKDEIRAGCPSGRLYAEALSLALSTRLRARYSRGNVPLGRYGFALSSAQVRCVREYIQAHLASDISLMELARLVHLSPHYFSTLFKHALGVPPHQYVLQQRIHEAQRQLALGRMPISDVALKVGFSDQSHFSRAFRKATGTTPKRYQSFRARSPGTALAACGYSWCMARVPAENVPVRIGCTNAGTRHRS